VFYHYYINNNNDHGHDNDNDDDNDNDNDNNNQWSHNLNPLSPNINMYLLHTVLHTFLMVLLERICSNITTFHLW